MVGQGGRPGASRGLDQEGGGGGGAFLGRINWPVNIVKNDKSIGGRQWRPADWQKRVSVLATCIRDWWHLLLS